MDMAKTGNTDATTANVCNCNPVIIADDEPFNIIALEGLLQARGVKVDKVFNGQSLLAKI